MEGCCSGRLRREWGAHCRPERQNEFRPAMTWKRFLPTVNVDESLKGLQRWPKFLLLLQNIRNRREVEARTAKQKGMKT